MRARLALAVSGTACQLREVVLRNKPQALLDASPKGTVPVLVLADGKVLEQSLDIMLWALTEHDPEQWLAPPRQSLDEMLALVAQCDGMFKHHLDRYKYPQRYLHPQQTSHALDESQTRGGSEATLKRGYGGLAFAHDSQAQGGADEASNALLGQTLANESRAQAGQWLLSLEQRLTQGDYLFGSRPALADMAIFPFVRQFAHVDRAWFDTQPWPRLKAWLQLWLASALFERIMHKYTPWVDDPDALPVEFPPMAGAGAC